ncbi:2OG-Fe(II) oxygenase [Oceanibacterium hippocampi]|uniref:Fe2OG dioxygenase domain-containing protein n=1 Tax=Oceanibacterium hippocampi TaxID=745714 RepID=A0A1Y5T5E4_9PROT|nr:2OG-Fe(II) oxygenase [Oceanibacterium hippocampi]SLN55838.1 hypothetical protein OCH7691_02398 [Oceanibacterium hippocampi]
MQHFLELFLDALPIDFCEDIIARFEGDSRKYPSRTANSANPKGREGTMLSIGELADWQQPVDRLLESIRHRIALYIQKYPGLKILGQPDQSYLTPPLMERILPGQSYDWHIDAGPAMTQDRLLSVLIYLRDVKDGGLTEFPMQEAAVRPKAGAMLLFPPFWTHVHRGAPPVAGTKYNITCYLSLRQAQAQGQGRGARRRQAAFAPS